MGQSPATFWDLSFREYQLAVDGLVEARRRQIDDMIYLAHQSASLVAYAYHQPKKLPKLDSLLQPTKPVMAGRAQTPHEQIAVLKSIMSNRKR